MLSPSLRTSSRFGGVADLLVDDGHRAAHGVCSRDGQRNALSVFVHTQDDELPRLRFFRDVGRLHLHERDRFMQRTLGYDSVHLFVHTNHSFFRETTIFNYLLCAIHMCMEI